MEELLNLDYFAQFLTPAHVKMIVFVWSIIKCTFLFLVSLKLFSFLAQKMLEKITQNIHSQVRKQQLVTFNAILIHAIKAIIIAVYVVSMLNLLELIFAQF